MKYRVLRMTPHCAILISNMYIVFFLIDRVNTAMGFIDNGLTKGLLTIMCLFSGWCSLKLMSARRRKTPVQSYLPKVNLLLCAALLFMILLDAVLSKVYLFNGKPMKLFALIVCLVNFADSAMLIAWQRADVRRAEAARNARLRRNRGNYPPRRTAQSRPAPTCPEYRGRFAEYRGGRY